MTPWKSWSAGPPDPLFSLQRLQDARPEAARSNLQASRFITTERA
jgi:hypothetical protein